MKKYRLGDIATVEISTVDKKSNEGERPVRLCNFVDVYRNWSIVPSMVNGMMLATAKEAQIEKFQLKKGQVAITKDSETRYDIGIATYITEDMENVVLGYHCALITPDDSVIDGAYLNAFFHSSYIQRYFENNATGSGMRYTLSVDTILNIPILAPNIKKQREIGKLFSSIDRRITLNRAINHNLTLRLIPVRSSGGAIVCHAVW